MRTAAVALALSASLLTTPALAAVTATFAKNPCAPVTMKVSGKKVKVTVCTLLNGQPVSTPAPSHGRFTETQGGDGSYEVTDTKTGVSVILFKWTSGYTDSYGLSVTGGNEYLWVDAAETDNGSSAYLSDYDNFGLVDASGRIYAAGTGTPQNDSEPNMPVVNLSKGIQNRGWMEFTVPNITTGETGTGRYSLVWNEGGAIAWSKIANFTGS